MSIELPEHLRSGPLAEAAARALQDANAMAASSNSVPRISLRGREFRLIEGGEEIAKFRDFLDVIMVGVEPEPGMMIKTYYEKGYSQGAKEPPTCSSDDGIAPSPWVQNPQNKTCRDCPKNQYGSGKAMNNKPTKACRDSKRVWLKLADTNLVPVAGAAAKPYEVPPFEERTLYGMNVTVASLKSFSDHGKELASLGQGPAVCVTRMTMADAEFPQIVFNLQAWLSAQDAPLSLELSNKRPWRVKYANAGLALASDGSGGPITRNALPTSVSQVPDHLRQQPQQVDQTLAAGGHMTPGETVPQGTQTVVDATPAGAKPVGDIDDAVGKW